MSDATGFLNRDLQLAQVTFKKFTDVVSQYGTDQGRGGMNAGAIQGLTELSTNLAATTGLTAVRQQHRRDQPGSHPGISWC